MLLIITVFIWQINVMLCYVTSLYDGVPVVNPPLAPVDGDLLTHAVVHFVQVRLLPYVCRDHNKRIRARRELGDQCISVKKSDLSIDTSLYNGVPGVNPPLAPVDGDLLTHAEVHFVQVRLLPYVCRDHNKRISARRELGDQCISVKRSDLTIDTSLYDGVPVVNPPLAPVDGDLLTHAEVHFVQVRLLPYVCRDHNKRIRARRELGDQCISVKKSDLTIDTSLYNGVPGVNPPLAPVDGDLLTHAEVHFVQVRLLPYVCRDHNKRIRARRELGDQCISVKKSDLTIDTSLYNGVPVVNPALAPGDGDLLAHAEVHFVQVRLLPYVCRDHNKRIRARRELGYQCISVKRSDLTIDTSLYDGVPVVRSSSSKSLLYVTFRHKWTFK